MRLNLVTAPTATAVGTTTIGQTTVAVPDTSLLAGALGVSGAGIPRGTGVLSIDSATQITLTQAATATGTPTLTFAMEPVSLAEARLHLRLPSATDNALIAALISAARRACEKSIAVSFLSTVWDLSLDGFPWEVDRRFCPAPPWQRGCILPLRNAAISLPRAPVVSVASVNYYDLDGTAQVLGTANYDASTGTPGAVAPSIGNVWPIAAQRLDAVRIRFTAGFGPTADSVPETAKCAIKLMLTHLYENRGEVDEDLPCAVEALLAAEDWGSYA